MITDYFSIDASLRGKGKLIPYDALPAESKIAYFDTKLGELREFLAQHPNVNRDDIYEKVYCGGDEINDICNEVLEH